MFSHLQDLESSYERVVATAVTRRRRLEEARELWQLYSDLGEDEDWVNEKKRILLQEVAGKPFKRLHLNSCPFYQPDAQMFLSLFRIVYCTFLEIEIYFC